MRYALIDLSTNVVSNVVEIAEGDGSTTPAGFLTLASDTADIGDSWDGEKFILKQQPSLEESKGDD